MAAFTPGALGRAVLAGPAGKVARRLSDWVDLEGSFLTEILTALAPRAKGQLLDVGCGQKPYEGIFHPHVDNYVGVEFAETFTRTNSSTKTGRPDFVYDGKTLPFESKTFDTILSIQVLEHTPTPGPLIIEMSRVMKDDGLMILTAPFSFRLHEEPDDYYRYSPHALRRLCRDAGLEVTHIEPRGGLFSVIGHKLNSYLALNVAQIDAMAQAMGKLGHEKSSNRSVRWWTLPWVAPTMGAIAFGARALDRVLPDPTETLGFCLVAERLAR
jgi:SAM-dependent methyltransferase